MDVNGLARVMAQQKGGEEFLIYVADVIEKQLKEWSNDYEVFLMKLEGYELMISNKGQYYHVKITEKELETLKIGEQYALDRKIWQELKKQELPINKGMGNYLDRVL